MLACTLWAVLLLFVLSAPSRAVRSVNIEARQASGLKQYTVEGDVYKHNFTFIVGAHHSGTTLIDLLTCLSPDATCLKHTGSPEDEGSHLQSVYPEARKLGGMLRYGFADESHMTERDSRVSNETTLKLFGAWSPFWNLTRRTCVEKSPPHLTKTRFFQAVFTPERTRFVVMLRHPLATTHFVYKKRQSVAAHKTRVAQDCGRDWVRHFLVIYHILLADMLEGLDPDHVMFVPYEHLMGHGLADTAAGEARMQRLMHRYYQFLGLTPAEQDLQFEIPETAASNPQPPPSFNFAGGSGGAQRRRKKTPELIRQQIHALEQQLDEFATSTAASSSTTSTAAPKPFGARRGRRLQAWEGKPEGATGGVVDFLEKEGGDGAADGLGEAQASSDHAGDKSLSAEEQSPFAVAAPGRRLLEYHGSRRSVSVIWADPLDWLKDFQALLPAGSDVCRKLGEELDVELLKLGYSIKNLSYVGKPQIRLGHLLWED